MPSLQTAQVDNYDFGAPSAAAVNAVAATATITFSGQPSDGEVVVIGTPSGEATFEFDSNSSVAAGHVAVTIGAAAANTAQSLKAAINAANLGVTATGGSTTLTLTANTPGVAGNSYDLSENATNVAVVGFAGGVDASASEGVISFSIKNGGKLHLHFENPVAESASLITVEFSTDGITWAASGSTANLAAISGVTLTPKQSLDYTVLARAGVDKFMRITASGGNRIALQIRHAASVGLGLVRM